MRAVKFGIPRCARDDGVNGGTRPLAVIPRSPSASLRAGSATRDPDRTLDGHDWCTSKHTTGIDLDCDPGGGTLKTAKAIAIAIVAALLIASAARAEARKIKKTDLPEVVRETADREASGARVVAYWRNVVEGSPIYEVDLKVEDRNKGILIAEDGEILAVQEEVVWDDLPPGVQESFRRVAGDRDIEEVHSVTRNGEIVGYGARIDGDHGDFHIEVGPRGEPRGEAATRHQEAWREREPKP